MLMGQVPIEQTFFWRLPQALRVGLLWTIFSILLLSSSWATVNVVRYPTGTPVQVCQPSDSNSNCQGSGGGSPGGSNTQVQYNSSGSFAGNSGFVYNGTNVGIGSINPGSNLDVQGTVRIFGTGNVGINSLNPGQQLDVQGTLRLLGNGSLIVGTTVVSDTGTLAQFTSSTNNYNQMIMQNTSNGSSASTNYIVNNNNGTANTYYGEFGMNSSGFSGSDSFSLPNAVYLDSQSGDLVLGTLTNNNVHFELNGSATDTMTMSASNVGIGSANPGQALDVKGTVRMTGFNLSTSPTNNYVLTSNANGNGTWQASSGSGTVNSGTAGQNAYYSSSTNAVSGNNDLIINGSNMYANQGNVGIGTSLSKNLLDVAGGISIGTTYAGYQTANSNGLSMQGNIGIGTVTAPTNIYNAGNTTLIGNVGINTAVGAHNLIVGNFIDMDSNGVLTASGGINGNSGFVTTATSGFQSNVNGQTLIGDSNTSSGSSTVYYGGTNSGSQEILRSTQASTATTDAITFEVGPSSGYFKPMIITDTGSGGNIGIGTTTPQSALDVWGTVGAFHSLVVNTAGNVGMGTYLPLQQVDLGPGRYIGMYDSGGSHWHCAPAVTTGVFTCTSG